MIRLAILTLSDKASAGKRTDESGGLIQETAERVGWKIVHREVLPDDAGRISSRLITLADHGNIDLILTTGGTGLSARDETPEATRAVIEKEAPGFSEAIRYVSMKETPHAILSRGVSGIRGSTLIINLPGSTNGVRDGLEVLLPILPHAIEILRGSGGSH